MPSDPLHAAGMRIAEARKRKGVTQAELARQASLTRQALNQIERGVVLPRVDTALRLADVLGMPLEALFREEMDERVPVVLLEPGEAREGMRVDLARINDRWIACATDSPARAEAGIGISDGRLLAAAGAFHVETPHSLAELEENIFVAGCDPALALICELTSQKVAHGRCVWIPCGSSAALDLLARGFVHLAGIHFGRGDDGNLEQIRLRGLEAQTMVIRFSRWEQGWMFRAKSEFRAAEDLAGGRLRLVNREEGSACRQQLDALLARLGIVPGKIPGYEDVSRNHAESARRIARGDADIGVGCEPMARVAGLEFASLAEVAFDLVVQRAHVKKPLVEAFLHTLTERKFARRMAEIPGYAVEETGRVIGGGTT